MKTYEQPQDITMNNQTSHVRKESGLGNLNNHISADIPPSMNLEELKVLTWKRSHNSHENSSSATPTKKTCTSSIRAGLEKTEAAVGKQEAAPRLFQYFRKATDEEQKEYLARMDEEIENRMEKENFYSQKVKLERETKIRNQNRERKRLQRKRTKNLEIKSGLRSPGGSKRQVRLTIQQSIQY